MPLKKDQILAALPGLSQPDLLAIRAAISALLGPDQGKPAPQGVGPLYEALLAYLGLPGPQWGRFATSRAGQAFKQATPNVLAFMGAFGPLKRVERLAIYKVVFGLLAADLKRRGIPVSLSTLSYSMERVPDVFKSAYPGYLEGGLGLLIVKSITRKKRDPENHKPVGT